MKDHRRFTLRELTEQIYYLREFVLKHKHHKYINSHEISDLYDELWRKRNELEEDIFDKKE